MEKESKEVMNRIDLLTSVVYGNSTNLCIVAMKDRCVFFIEYKPLYFKLG